MSDSDVAIAGAGIGGTCAAIALAKRGAKVLLLEAGHFPRHKVCGEFLSPESREVFERIGILETILNTGAKSVSTARIIAPRGRTLETQFPKSGISISRLRLDEILWRAAQEAGVLCAVNTRVKKIESAGEKLRVDTFGASYNAEIVMDATGRNRLSSRADANGLEAAPRFLGLKAHFQNVRIESGSVELHFWREGYCGLVQVEDDACNVCLLAGYDRSDAKNNNPLKIWHRVLRSCPALRRRLESATQITEWQTTANVQFAAREPRSDSGVLRIGDAAGYIHPLTGDGMAMAARSGELAAAVAAAKLRGSLSTREAAQLYELAWRREFEARLKAGDVLAKVLLSPVLPAPLIGLLARMPGCAQKLVGVTRGAIL